MKYSETNLMRLLGEASRQMAHNGGREREEHDMERGRACRGGGNKRVGYPNCPGPGCGNNCPYKGTEECPKMAVRGGPGGPEGSGPWDGPGGPGGPEGPGPWDGPGGPGGPEGPGPWDGPGGPSGPEGHGPWGGPGGPGGPEGHGPWGGPGGPGGPGGHGPHGGHGGPHGGPGGHGPHGGPEGPGPQFGPDEWGPHDWKAPREPMGRERILALLDEEGAVRQNKLAEQLGIRPQSVSELLVKLERDGYIIRKQNEQDKREILVSLSEEGRARAREVKEMQEKQAEDFLSPLDQDERQTLFALLMKLMGDAGES